MSDNIAKLMRIEQNIVKFIDENNDLSDKLLDDKFEETHYIEKCINIIKKMSNKEILEAIKRLDYINMFVDYKVFLKKYRVNKKALKEDPKLCLEEYDKLNNICEVIGENSNNKKEFLEYMQILDIDNAQEYLLKMMPNDDLNT